MYSLLYKLASTRLVVCYLVLAIHSVILTQLAHAVSFSEPGFMAETVVTLAPFKPVGVTWAADGRMFIWQRDGIVRVYKNGQLLATPFLDIHTQVNAFNDRGFLGFTLDPNFAVNGYVYLLYTYEEAGNPNDAGAKTSRLVRMQASPPTSDVVNPGSTVVLLGSLGTPPCSQYPVGADCIPSDSDTHSVGMVRFGRDGKMYMSHGDGASASFADPLALRSQDLNQFSGKILRLNADGTAPTDTPNPFYDGSNSVQSKVWAKGLRNPYRFGFHPVTGVPFIGDVGWNTNEEQNKGMAGGNYGWPCYEGRDATVSWAGFSTCQALSPSAVTFSVYEYTHADGNSAVGGAFVAGTQYPAQYVGSYLFADYGGRWIRRMTFDSNGNPTGVTTFASNVGTTAGGIVHLDMGPDGYIYYVEFSTGAIVRVRHTAGGGGNLAPTAVISASPVTGYSPLTVSFSSAGSSDPELLPLAFLWNFGDQTTSTLANPQHTYTAGGVQSFTATLTVTDSAGLTSTASTVITVGSAAPVATITTSANGSPVTIGQTVVYSGSATDPDDGPLPSSALTWTVLLHHNTHVHPFTETVGSSGSFVVDNHDPAGRFSYEIQLKATDSSGANDVKTVLLPVFNPATEPMAAFGFNEGSGTTAVDESGNGHNGTLSGGVAWTSNGKYGSALLFSGGSSAVSLANPGSFNFGTSDFTIEMWVKRDELNISRHLLSKCGSSWAPGCKEFYFDSSSNLLFGSFGTGDTVSVSINDLFWHHLAVTFVDATNTMRFYVDGVLKTTATKALEADTAGHAVRIGHQPGASSFNGVLDEVRIYPRALVLEEIILGMATPITPVVNTTPPILSNEQPTGTLAAGTTQATLSVVTNENATCRYSLTAGVAYANMTNTFSATGGTTHNTLVTGLSNGQTYTYYVRCQDSGNNPTTSDLPITFAIAAPDITPPTVAVTAPVAGATVAGTTTINATASDNVGGTGVAGVQFLLDGAILGAEDTTAPYSIAWNTTGATNGTHTLTARARDGTGNTTTSTGVSVTVSNVVDPTPPTVAVTAPVAGATVAGTTTINATASDNVGGTGVAGVQFLLDGAILGAEDTTAPYSIAWNTTGATNGTHTLTARARDGAGNTTTSTGVSVTVSNAASTGLVTALGLNEGTGTTAADASGSGHTGTLVNGATWVVGQFGSGVSIEGTTAALTVAAPDTLNFGTADYTINLWVKRNALGVTQRMIFSKCHVTGWTTGCKELYFNSSNRLVFGSFSTGDTLSATMGDTNWHHIAVTFTDSTNTLRMYVDGVLATTATKALEADVPGHVVAFGNMHGDNRLAGVVDNIRIYNRVLTQTEIQTDMATSVAP